MSDDGGETQTVVQSQDTAPWAGQQPFLTEGFNRAKTDVLDRPLEYYRGSTVTPFSAETEQALGMAQNRALAGSPLNQAAQSEAQKVLSGGYLMGGSPSVLSGPSNMGPGSYGPESMPTDLPSMNGGGMDYVGPGKSASYGEGGNPAYQGMVDRAVAPLTRQYNETIRPGIMSAFTGAGRSGSNIARAQVENTAANDYMRQVGDIGSALSYANYNDERNRMGQMTQMAPALAQQDYFDIGQLANVGGQREAMSQAQLQDMINRFNFAQQEPTNRLGQYMGLVQGGYGTSGTSSTIQPVQGGNPILGALGGGLMGAGALSSLFGASGAFPNVFR